MEHWWSGTGGTATDLRLRQEFSRRAGARRRAELSERIEEFARPRQRSLLLGAVGPHVSYLGAGAAGTTFLVGADVAAGPPAWDVGWALGEVFANCPTQGCDDGTWLDPSAGELLRATAPQGTVDREQVARALVLRTLLSLLEDQGSSTGVDEFVEFFDTPRRGW